MNTDLLMSSVGKIQQLKKAFENFSKKDIDFHKARVLQWESVVDTHFAEKRAFHQKLFDKICYNQFQIPAGRKPKGLTLVLLPKVDSINLFLQVSLTAAYSQNCVLFLSQEDKLHDRLQSICTDWDGFAVEKFDPEIFQSLVQHPAVNSVVGFFPDPEKYFTGISQKKAVGYYGPVKPCAILHSESGLNYFVKDLFKNLSGFSSGNPYYVSRLFVADPILQAFWQSVQNYSGSELLLANKGFEALALKDQNQVSSQGDQGLHWLNETSFSELKPLERLLVNLGEGLSPALFAKDLNQCSVLQVDQLMQPLILVNSYKYFSEAVKFINNSALGSPVSLYSEADFFERNHSKLDAAITFHQQMPTPLCEYRYRGIKGSFLGSADASLDGEIWFWKTSVIS